MFKGMNCQYLVKQVRTDVEVPSAYRTSEQPSSARFALVEKKHHHAIPKGIVRPAVSWPTLHRSALPL